MAESELKTGFQLPEGLKEILQAGLAAREEELAKVNAWARSNARQLIAGEVDYPSVAEEIGISVDSLYRPFHLIASLLYRGDPIGSIDVESYATALGAVDSNLPAKARVLLAGIQVEKEEAGFARSRGVVSQAVLPTLGSFSALCELRAVFQELPSPSTSKMHREAVGNLLGFEPMVIIGLETNDFSSNDTSSSFQVTERALRNMIRTLEDALLQLEVVREYHKQSLGRS